MLVLLVLFVTVYGKQARESYVLEELLHPFFMRVDDTQLYVSQGPEIMIYSLNNFKLKKRIGRSGEGPGEFRVSPTQNLGSILFDLTDEHIIVYSIGKTSFFKKDGTYMREMRSTRFGLKPIGDRFVGYGFIQDKGTTFITINMYDTGGDIIKEFHREKAFSINQSRINLFDMRSSLFMSVNNRIIVEMNKNRIEIFDSDGTWLKTIKPDIPDVCVTDLKKKEFRHYLETDPKFKAFYPVIRDRLLIPDNYPPVCLFDAVEDTLFIMTFFEDDSGRKVLEYDLNSDDMKTHSVSEFFSAMFLPAPYAFDRNHFYQLHENDRDENFEVIITPLSR